MKKKKVAYIVYSFSGQNYEGYFQHNIKVFFDKEKAEDFVKGATQFRKEFTYDKWEEIETEFYESPEYEEGEDFCILPEVQFKYNELIKPFISPYDGSYPYDDLIYKVEEVEIEK